MKIDAHLTRSAEDVASSVKKESTGPGEARSSLATRFHACVLGLMTLTWLGAIALLWAWRAAGLWQLAITIVVSYLLVWSLVYIVSRKPHSELRIQFLLTTASFGLIVIVGEVTAWSGLIDYRVAFHTPNLEPWGRPTVRLDPELLHITLPHTRVPLSGPALGDIAISQCLPQTTNARRDYEIVYDRNGFRNTRDRDVVDIAVIGDSFLEVGRDSELLPALLERFLRVPVANLGQSLYGPQQELVVLRRYAVLLRPKVVVWAFFEDNDLKDVHRYNKSRQQWAAISRRLQSPWVRSFTWNAFLAVHRLGDRCEPTRQSIKRSGLLPTAGGEARMYFGSPARPLSRRDLDALEQVRLVFQEAHELSRVHRFSLMVLFIPGKFRVYHDLIRCEPESECADWVIHDLPQRLGRMLTEVSPATGYLDLTPWLAAEARKGVLVYPLDDTHWSLEGTQVAAAAVSESLARIIAPAAAASTQGLATP